MRINAADKEDSETNLTPIDETKGIETRDANAGTVLLHPYIRSHFALHLFIDAPRIPNFRKLARHWTTEDESCLAPSNGDVDKDANVETTLDPGLG